MFFQVICSTCKGKPARKGQKTCVDCHAAYMRDYRPRNRESIEDRAFQRGADAFRKQAIEVFTNLGRAEMNGVMVVDALIQLRFRSVPRATVKDLAAAVAHS